MKTQKCKLESLGNYFGDKCITTEYYPLRTGKEKHSVKCYLESLPCLGRAVLLCGLTMQMGFGAAVQGMKLSVGVVEQGCFGLTLRFSRSTLFPSLF